MRQLIDVLSLIGCIETLIFLLYAIRYYLFSFIILKTRIPSNNNFPELSKNSKAFITLLLPTYNEQNVIDRLLTACTSFDFPNYEVILIDDSIDESMKTITKWKNHPRLKVIHRMSREGWKGGALNVGLNHVNPRSTHVLILDADFIPPKNLLQRFLTRFTDDQIVVVQGYQVHDLNAEENWVTKGVRVMFSVANMIEMNAKNKLKLLLPITGSVYMIRTDLLKKLRFDKSITEDWSLTLKLYMAGYKVIYDPTLTASAECSNTLLKFFRQNARWAEGHTRYFRKHFWEILKNKYLSVREKLEFLFLGSLYLNTVLVVTTTIGGLLVLGSDPNLTYSINLTATIIGICFTILGILSVIFADIVALKSESCLSDLPKIPYSLILGYITTPVTAYSSLKGLLSDRGHFHRTYKTGKITKVSIVSYLRELFKSKFSPHKL
jgi:cellulose synthase/poly-beta-1,6-N-acetylglucosamine synthase-like glycosyltransferase